MLPNLITKPLALNSSHANEVTMEYIYGLQ